MPTSISSTKQKTKTASSSSNIASSDASSNDTRTSTILSETKNNSSWSKSSSEDEEASTTDIIENQQPSRRNGYHRGVSEDPSTSDIESNGVLRSTTEEEDSYEPKRTSWCRVTFSIALALAFVAVLCMVLFLILNKTDSLPPSIAQLLKQEERPISSSSSSTTVPPPNAKLGNISILCSSSYIQLHSYIDCSSACAPGSCCFLPFHGGNCILENILTCPLYSPCGNVSCGIYTPCNTTKNTTTTSTKTNTTTTILQTNHTNNLTNNSNTTIEDSIATTTNSSTSIKKRGGFCEDIATRRNLTEESSAVTFTTPKCNKTRPCTSDKDCFHKSDYTLYSCLWNCSHHKDWN